MVACIIAKRWIKKRYNASTVLNSVGLAASTYYYNIAKENKKENKDNKTPAKKQVGRKIPGFSLSRKREKISDEQIKEYLCELVAGDGFPYGYKKLTICLQEDYNLIINHKKVYRLCKELDILRPQRKIYTKRPRKLAKREKVTGPNQALANGCQICCARKGYMGNLHVAMQRTNVAKSVINRFTL